MSKERLEEIKDLLRLTKKENFVEDYYVLIKLFEYGHADWLIQQVERVEDNDQAIVDLNKHVEELEDENVDLEQQNKRYREAIEKARRELETCARSAYLTLSKALEESE